LLDAGHGLLKKFKIAIKETPPPSRAAKDWKFWPYLSAFEQTPYDQDWLTA
jgi:hypothetical protein